MSAFRGTRPTSLSAVRDTIISCEACTRLRSYCKEIGLTRKAAFRNEVYWARPVPGFGDPKARVLILGLAPAAHGANRTGRVFTGDGVGASGDFLMAALKRAGFANIPTSQRVDDGLQLTDTYIAAAVRCAPPANKPLPEEVERCLPHLANEIAHLPNLQVVAALGKIAWDAWLKLLATTGTQVPRPRPVFAHGAKWTHEGLTLVGAYHPSRQNTNTGVVTPRMYDADLSERETIAALMNERNARFALAAAFFFYVLWMRTYDVATTFLMLGEQTRDWAVAMGGITELPLTGAPSTAGGRGLGPPYYWLLWIGRMTIGPFMDNLPHAGGFIVALWQSIADVWLFIVLSRRCHWAFALAMCLLIASAPFDIALSSLIWNPPVAAAFIKMATAMALSLTPASPVWAAAVAAALAWMGVQSHMSALFVAAPLLAALALQPLVQRSSNWRRTIVERAGLIAVTVLALQMPFLISVFREPSAPAGPAGLIAGLIHPQVFRPWFAYGSVTGITANLVMPLYNANEYAFPVMIAAIVVAIVYRRDAVVIAVTGGAIAAATLLFTTSTRAYDGYWFITLTTALTLTFGMAIAAIPSKTAVKWIGVASLALIIWRQPARIEDSKRFFKYPQYDPMVRGSRELAMRAPVVRDITTDFEVHPTMDRTFVYKILGGRIDPAALSTAIIASDGTVRLATH